MKRIMSKNFPLEITTYDLLKSVAVILMIIDHTGAYLFPDQEWWRVFGRLCVPMWFFLIGYAKTRSVPWSWYIGALILVIANMVVGLFIFPLSVLGTMIFIRFALDPIIKLSLANQRYLYTTCAILFFLAIPSDHIFEYGTQGLIIAMFGYFVRNKESLPHKDFTTNFMVFSFITFALFQYISFGFATVSMVFMGLGLAIVFCFLLSFKGQTLPELSLGMPIWLKGLIQVLGRHTLEIYVVHLLILKFAALYLGKEQFGLFEFTLYLGA